MNNRREDAGGRGFNPIPSLLTLCNALCGFGAIALAFRRGGDPAVAVPTISLWLVFFAMFFDVFDGLSARLLQAASLHGMQLDSLADAISFGVAPATFVFLLGRQAGEGLAMAEPVAWLVAGLYLSCALWRLAVYNVRALEGADGDDERAAFTGLPSPAAAGIVCGMTLLLPTLSEGLPLFWLSMLYASTAALLMVGPVAYPHVRRVVEGMPAAMRLALLLLIVASFMRFGKMALVLWAHVYVLVPTVTDAAVRLDRRFALAEKMHLPGRR